MSVTMRLKQKVLELLPVTDSLLEPVTLPDLSAKGKPIKQGKRLSTSDLEFMYNLFKTSHLNIKVAMLGFLFGVSFFFLSPTL